MTIENTDEVLDESLNDPSQDLAAAFEAALDDTGGEGAGAGQEPPAGEATGGQPRDEAGRFAAKPGEAQAPAAGQPPPQDPAKPGEQPQAPAEAQPPQDPAQAAERAPNSWSATAKAKFSTLDPEIQAEIVKRERDMERGIAEIQPRLQFANALGQVLAPYEQHRAVRGQDPIGQVKALLTAQDFLDRDPRSGIVWLARSYGVDLGQLAEAAAQSAGAHQPPAPQPGQGHQPPADPRYAALEQETARLRQMVEGRETAERQAQIEQLSEQIRAFAADPANRYYEQVKSHMAALLKGGVAKDLQDAYAQACYARPDIRAQLQAEEAKAKQEADAKAAREKAAAARRASGPSGVPHPSAQGARGVEPADTIEDELRRQFAEVGRL